VILNNIDYALGIIEEGHNDADDDDNEDLLSLSVETFNKNASKQSRPPSQ
jgi:hypothetical protein